MKLKLIILSMFFIVHFAEAQSYLEEYKKYGGEGSQLNQYPKDPSAEAVVIYDIGKSYFHLTDYEGFELIFERKMAIKIFTKAGLKWAQISIPYYEEGRRCEIISDLTGNTYNLENGTIHHTALDSTKTYNEKINEHWYNNKFAMPDVKEGSVIEISYTISSPYLFNLRDWEFQRKIPVIYSDYTTQMTPFYEYRYILQGANKFDKFSSNRESGFSHRLGTHEYHDMVYNFIMKDIPAFKDESFITSSNDYIIKLGFQLTDIHRPDGSNQAIMTTWPKMSQELIDHDSFGKYIKNSQKKCKEITDTIHLASKTALEKAKIIEHFMKSTFNWNGNNDKYSSKGVKEFLSRKTGNSAELNLFLIGMLNAVGIEVYPVILSTRSNGKILVDYPFSHFFNYVIAEAKIDGETYLLDATEPFSAFNEIPSRCINDKGLVIQKNKVEWVDLKSKSSSATEYNFDLRFNSARDTINGNCKLISTGYDAIRYRNKFNSSYKELKKELMGGNALSADSLKQENLNKIAKPFGVSFNIKNSIETVEDKLIISPFCNATLTENPLKQPSRSFPIDMVYRNENKFRSTVKIPDGYKLFVKPANLDIDNKMVKITFSTEMVNNETIKVTGAYEFKNEIYGSSDYSDLKDYFNKIVDKFNEKLVLVKI